MTSPVGHAQWRKRLDQDPGEERKEEPAEKEIDGEERAEERGKSSGKPAQTQDLRVPLVVEGGGGEGSHRLAPAKPELSPVEFSPGKLDLHLPQKPAPKGFLPLKPLQDY